MFCWRRYSRLRKFCVYIRNQKPFLFWPKHYLTNPINIRLQNHPRFFATCSVGLRQILSPMMNLPFRSSLLFSASSSVGLVEGLGSAMNLQLRSRPLLLLLFSGSSLSSFTLPFFELELGLGPTTRDVSVSSLAFRMSMGVGGDFFARADPTLARLENWLGTEKAEAADPSWKDSLKGRGVVERLLLAGTRIWEVSWPSTNSDEEEEGE